MRFKAETANESFNAELSKFVPKESVADFYKLVVKDIFKQKTSPYNNRRKELLSDIQTENDKMAKARKLLLEDTIESGDYKLIKAECETKLLSLEAKLTGFGKPEALNLTTCIDKAVTTLSQLQMLYNVSDTGMKRNIIGSIYPEKLCFDGLHYRTAKINEAARLIFLINSELGVKKNRTKLDFSSLSDSVATRGIEPLRILLIEK